MNKDKTSPIYQVWSSNSKYVPIINWGRKENRQYDWTPITEMFDGKRPIEQDYFNSVEITVNSRAMKFDFLSWSINWLISERTKSVLENLALSRVGFYKFKVNGADFYRLVPNEFHNVIDIEFSDKDAKKYKNFTYPIRKFTFFKEKIPSPSIFRIELKYSAGLYVTEDVKQAVEDAKLIGWQFVHCEKQLSVNGNVIENAVPPPKKLFPDIRIGEDGIWTIVEE